MVVFSTSSNVRASPSPFDKNSGRHMVPSRVLKKSCRQRASRPSSDPVGISSILRISLMDEQGQQHKSTAC